jgi:hypothetical protein
MDMSDNRKINIPRTPDREAEFDNLLSLLDRNQRELAADPEFDTYEKVGESYVWRAVSIGMGHALAKLKELSKGSTNEFVVMHTFSGKVVVRLNSSHS